MIDFNSLEQSLSAITQIGKGESTIDVNGVSITLRVLNPDEELEVQKSASDVLKVNKDSMDAVATLEYLDKFRLGVLSHAIVEINGQDFRGVQFIETGDTLPNGKRVQIPKPQALKKLLSSFSRTILVGIFKKYTELVEKTEFEAEKFIEFSVEDSDSEIARLRERISELERSKEERLKKEKDFMATQVRLASQTSNITLKDAPKVEAEEPQAESEDLESEVARENDRLIRERRKGIKVPPPNV